MLYISICITLLTIVATLYVWSKMHQAQPNKFYNWIIYGVLLVSFVILFCQLSRGVMRMCCHKGGPPHEMRCEDDMACRNHEMMQQRHMDKCLMERSGMKKECGEDEDDDDETTDSTSHQSH